MAGRGPGSVEVSRQGYGGARLGYGYPLTQCNANTFVSLRYEQVIFIACRGFYIDHKLVTYL